MKSSPYSLLFNSNLHWFGKLKLLFPFLACVLECRLSISPHRAPGIEPGYTSLEVPKLVSFLLPFFTLLKPDISLLKFTSQTSSKTDTARLEDFSRHFVLPKSFLRAIEHFSGQRGIESRLSNQIEQLCASIKRTSSKLRVKGVCFPLGKKFYWSSSLNRKLVSPREVRVTAQLYGANHVHSLLEF